jgi:hypothetical protein
MDMIKTPPPRRPSPEKLPAPKSRAGVWSLDLLWSLDAEVWRSSSVVSVSFCKKSVLICPRFNPSQTHSRLPKAIQSYSSVSKKKRSFVFIGGEPGKPFLILSKSLSFSARNYKPL